MLVSLTQRRRRPELMDQPELPPDSHREALRGLERINWWSGSTRLLWPSIRGLLRKAGPLRLLDVAAGAGDVPLRIWRRARREGLPLRVAGCDRSLTAVRYAREQAQLAGADIDFFVADVLGEALAESYDIVTCSLFLHHLDGGEAVEVLKRMGRLASRLLLVNDLRRCPLGMVAAYLGTRLLSSSPVVRADGPRSVAAAFTRREMLELARSAGLAGAEVTPRWPFRLLLRWERA
jgi:2-polyprenyl-3-methyl-5-hydroxy-6-metoxy-1,4-benzoquinol methylase